MIPKKALDQHIAVLGKTGSGKSYAVRGAAVEPLLEAGERVAIIDPTGAWYGLRSSADGKRAGFPVVIFGGPHADLPLGGAHGDAIAEVIGTSSTPAILDTSALKVSERTKFFADFADALIRKNRGPLHLVIDEAHLFAPQGRVSDPMSGQMLHATNNLVSLGRSRGLRVIMISQRPAKLHKDSLTQAETLIAMRLIAPQDRAAVEAWIKDNATEAKSQQILSSLATLKTGHGWIWAPELGILEQMTFPKIKTFDSGRAPDGNEASAKMLAPIDVEGIAARLESVSAQALADDPRRLRSRIAELERQAKAAGKPTPEALMLAKLEGRREGVEEFKKTIGQALRELSARLRSAVDEAFNSVMIDKEAGLAPAPQEKMQLRAEPAKAVPRPAGNGTMSKAERLVLTALAQYPDGRSKSQVAILTGYAVNGGGFSNAISSCRTHGWLEGSADRLKITETGLAAIGPFDPLPTGSGLLEYWYKQLARAERKALESLAEVYPRSLSKAQIASRAGYEANGGGFNNALSKLRTLDLISGRAEMRASDDLFG